MFCQFIASSLEKNKKCVVVVRGRHLVDQASKRLHDMGIDHGVFMANHAGYNPTHPIQVASIDTCRARKTHPPADLLIIDEAHFAISDSYKKFLEHYPDSVWLSVTATPWVRQGLKHLAEKVIYPITMGELIEQKYLSKPRYFIPNFFDSSNIDIKSGEYNEDQAFNEFERQKLYGSVTQEWLKHGVKKSSLCFAINLNHASALLLAFREVDARACVIDANWSLEERHAKIHELGRGELDIIINVGTMTVGVDIPFLNNIIFCRPTYSKILYVQMAGRGSRRTETKSEFKIIDHVENIKRHGFIEDEEPSDLEPFKRRAVGKSVSGIRCKSCYMVNLPSESHCIGCGLPLHSESVSKTKPIITKDGTLNELVYQELKEDFEKRAYWFWEVAKKNGYKIGFVWKKLTEEFGEEKTRENYRIYRKIKQLDSSRPSKPNYFAPR